MTPIVYLSIQDKHNHKSKLLTLGLGVLGAMICEHNSELGHQFQVKMNRPVLLFGELTCFDTNR